jgi:hypothetical protein
MILRELFYFNRETADPEQDDRFMHYRDTDVLDDTDTRKTRLTLGQINELRRSSDQHIKETQAELEFIARMYGAPPTEAAV